MDHEEQIAGIADTLLELLKSIIKKIYVGQKVTCLMELRSEDLVSVGKLAT